MKNLIVLGLIILFFAGCESAQWQEIACPEIEAPAANVPLALRQSNWADAKGSGSCVIASSCSVFHWANRPDLAAKFRKSYAGGQTDSSIKAKWKDARITFVAPNRDDEYGDPDALQWASDTRRAAIIWYFPNHCVTFCGFSQHQGREVAWLLDNNRTKQFIPVEKRQFISEWRKFGGFYATPLLTPAPSLPFPGYEVE